MMGVREVYKLFCDTLELYKKYAKRSLDEQELEGFADATHTLYEQYNNAPLAKDLMVALVSEIERLQERKK